MKILDIQGNEITNPDLDKGYLKTETLLIQHHDAIPESPAEYKTIQIGKGLFQQEIMKPWQPGKGAWDETEIIQRYIPYTEEELLAREQAKKEAEEQARLAEEAARKEAERKNMINALPFRIDVIEEAVAEVGVVAANASISMNDLMEAVAELGVMVAGIQEIQGGY